MYDGKYCKLKLGYWIETLGIAITFFWYSHSVALKYYVIVIFNEVELRLEIEEEKNQLLIPKKPVKYWCR